MAVSVAYQGNVSSGGSSVSSLTCDFSADLSYTPNSDANTLIVVMCYALNTNGVTYTADSNATALSWYEIGYQDGGSHPVSAFCVKASSVTSGDVTVYVSSARRLRIRVWEVLDAQVETAEFANFPAAGSNAANSGTIDMSATGEDGGGAVVVYNQTGSSTIGQDSDYTYVTANVNQVEAYNIFTGAQPTAEEHNLTNTSGTGTQLLAGFGAKAAGGNPWYYYAQQKALT